ncbi:MAG: DNA circularization N-terminal domain-containing protein [Treponema sp.]|nr:DNA circularization N-terminal domain-containing protein [Treponema sp.]
MATIKDGKYTAPSGGEHIFSYGDVSRETELKTGVYTYPMRDGARVQHQGKGATTFPLTCIFHGADCMEQASAFEDALIERDTGELQHPIYGTFKVKPTGNIVRDDKLVTSANQSTVTVTFTESIENDDENTMNEVAADTIAENHEAFEDITAEDFAESIAAIESVSEQLAIEAALEAQTQSMIDNLQPIASSDKKSFADWLASANELKDSIKKMYDKGIKTARSVENTYVKALNVARLTLRIAKLPARLSVNLSQKLQGYAGLTAVLINQFRNDPFEIKKIKNAYSSAVLGLSGAVASIASGAAISTAQAAASPGNSSVTNTRASASGDSSDSDIPAGASGAGYTAATSNSGTASREEAVETASAIIGMLEDMTAFGDSKTSQNAFVDANAASYMALNMLVYQSAQLIMNASFALPMQRTFTTDRDRQVIELCAELYGTVDCLDEFIVSNNFNIDEIELLPMGTKVTHYVQSA